MSSKETVQKSLSGIVGIFVILGIIVAVNIITSQVRLRKDLTEDKLYTLADGTKELIGSLQRDVVLKFYFSKSMEGMPIALKQYAQRIADLLSEYETHGQGRVALEKYDPQPDSDEEEWAQKYGLTEQGMGLFGGPSLYMGIVAVSGSKEASIPFIAPSAEPQLEYLLTRLVDEVTATQKGKVAVISSLPVMGTAPDTPFAPQQAPKSWIFIEELKKQYEVLSLDSAAEEVPEDVDTLILVHPKELGEATLYAIDQFVLRGGRLLAFVDPMCLAEQESSEQPGALFAASSDLNRLTRTWGLALTSGKVVADLKSASQVSFGQGGRQRSPGWLSLRGDSIDRDEIVTASLEILMLPFSGTFEGEPAEGLTMTTLLQSSEETSLIDAYTAVNPNANYGGSAGGRKQYPLAVRLQGTFKTAFPDGPPAVPADEETGEDTDEADVAPGEESLTESSEEGVVLLVGDVDMLYDRFIVRKINFFGQTLSEPLNDNLGFILNTLEQLAGSEALIGLRSRGTFDRPFHRVIELERKAQERWQQEEAALQEKVREAQTRINQLQAAKDDKKQKFIISPEQKREIEKFKKEKFETQRRLREVRKNLRGEIEMLGLKVKIINIALMPVAVGLFGVVRGWRRRKKALES